MYLQSRKNASPLFDMTVSSRPVVQNPGELGFLFSHHSLFALLFTPVLLSTIHLILRTLFGSWELGVATFNLSMCDELGAWDLIADLFPFLGWTTAAVHLATASWSNTLTTSRSPHPPYPTGADNSRRVPRYEVHETVCERARPYPVNPIRSEWTHGFSFQRCHAAVLRLKYLFCEG